MNEFLLLLGRIFFIAVLQIVIEAFIDPDKRPHHAMILNVACIMGCLYLLLDFILNNVLTKLASLINMPFF